ncbi:MAG: antibiotic biosynthesis monooxygenase [Rivularia sp. (in: Bacteria)]|nr:antibiotic biosynthesis monooxygenase [Rivularia sp. MS3]
MNQKNTVEVPIVLSGRYKIKPQKRERFLELANLGLESSRAESGNISYSLYEETGIPNSFIYFEEWKSREALVEHLKQPYITPLLEEFAELADGEANVRVYDIDNLTFGLPM